MKLNTITELQLELIINKNLYEKHVIDKNTFSKANERLLKMIKMLRAE